MTDTDHHWMRLAIQQSTHCPPSTSAFSVGAVIVAADQTLLATGYSRETPHAHAEQAALTKLDPNDPRLPTATIYSTMEPCGARSTHPHPCANLIINAGIRRVIYALAEPPIFVTPVGAQKLRSAHLLVIQLDDLAPAVEHINRYILDRGTADP